MVRTWLLRVSLFLFSGLYCFAGFEGLAGEDCSRAAADVEHISCGSRATTHQSSVIRYCSCCVCDVQCVAPPWTVLWPWKPALQCFRHLYLSDACRVCCFPQVCVCGSCMSSLDSFGSTALTCICCTCVGSFVCVFTCVAALKRGGTCVALLGRVSAFPALGRALWAQDATYLHAY